MEDGEEEEVPIITMEETIGEEVAAVAGGVGGEGVEAEVGMAEEVVEDEEFVLM